MWDILGDGKTYETYDVGHTNLIKSVKLSYDGYAIASAGRDGQVVISTWEIG